MKTRFPIRSIVRCQVCGARRRADCKRVRTFDAPTAIHTLAGPVTVPAGAVICYSHQTVEEFAADEARRALSRGGPA